MHVLIFLWLASASIVAKTTAYTYQTNYASVKPALTSATDHQNNLQAPSIGYNQPEISYAYNTDNQQYQSRFHYERPEQYYNSHLEVPTVSTKELRQPYYYSNVQSSPTITKDIFVHVAPEEPEQQPVHAELKTPPIPRKHYRIIFIKAPTFQANKAAVNVKQTPNEEKTIIYVLSKKPEPIQLEAAYQETSTEPNKPEVHFIKYKTKEEAELAQKHIQAQYDKFGGKTHFNEEIISPLYSVEKKLDSSSSQPVNSEKSSYNLDLANSEYKFDSDDLADLADSTDSADLANSANKFNSASLEYNYDTANSAYKSNTPTFTYNSNTANKEYDSNSASTEHNSNTAYQSKYVYSKLDNIKGTVQEIKKKK